jgi:cytochrome c556
MKSWVLATVVAAGVGSAGVALAQGNIVTERRAGLTRMEGDFEAIAAVVQARGDQRQLAGRIDGMIAFYRDLPNSFPAATLTPPLSTGRQPGETRARDTIDANRADFAQRNADMVNALTALKASAEAGGITGDTLRALGGTCLACHRGYRAR